MSLHDLIGAFFYASGTALIIYVVMNVVSFLQRFSEALEDRVDIESRETAIHEADCKARNPTFEP